MAVVPWSFSTTVVCYRAYPARDNSTDNTSVNTTVTVGTGVCQCPGWGTPRFLTWKTEKNDARKARRSGKLHSRWWIAA